MRKWVIMLASSYFSILAIAAESVGTPVQPYDLSGYCSFSDSTQKKIMDYFLKNYKSGIFNGTFLFFKNDSLIQGALGYANFEKRDTLINDDLFQLASITKTFTGMAIMLLQQDGILDVDDSVHWYIPEINRTNLTIRNLLTHQSGLPDYFYFSSAYWPNRNVHMRNEDVVTQLNLQSWKSFGIPATYYDYSNTNFALLSLIVERLTNMNFRNFIEIYITRPNGMRYTHICNYDSIPLEEYPVQGHENKRIYGDIPHNGTTGDKGVYSNTVEMFYLDRALRGPFLLHESYRDLMWSQHTATTNDGQYYGFGWRMKWIDGKKWVFHNGWWKGFRTYYWRCLDEDKCFVVLTNNVYGPFLRTSDLVDLLH